MTRCEATRLRKKWTQGRCQRNATVTIRGKNYCEQHAKIMVGLPPDVRLSAVESRTGNGA